MCRVISNLVQLGMATGEFVSGEFVSGGLANPYSVLTMLKGHIAVLNLSTVFLAGQKCYPKS